MRFRLKNQLTYPMDEELLDSIANAELTWAAKFYGWEEAPIAIMFSHIYGANDKAPYTLVNVSWNRKNEEVHWSPLHWYQGHLPLGELKDKAYYSLDEIGIEEDLRRWMSEG